MTPRAITGYSIYSADAAARRKRNTLNDLYPELPPTKYDIIYADPPWDYSGKLQFDKSSKSVDIIDTNKRIFISSASFKYPTLRLEELRKLAVPNIAEDNSLLFMWATSPHLNQAISLGESWGFKYRTIAFVWDKLVHNPGKYTLSNCEVCLVFKRGKIPSPRGARNVQQLVRAPRGKHSEKPVAVRDAVAAMFPTQRKIELFARHTSGGWNVWGKDDFPATVIPQDRHPDRLPLQQEIF